MLGMGVFADQHGNVKLLQQKGMALPVDDYKTITKDQVSYLRGEYKKINHFQQLASIGHKFLTPPNIFHSKYTNRLRK